MSPDRAAELIGRLTAKVAGWEPSIREFNALTQTDVNLALAFVQSMPARLLARVLYAGEVQFAENFEHELVDAIERGALGAVIDDIHHERWQLPRAGFIRDMCRLAIIETVSGGKCQRCSGRGFVLKRQGTLREDCVMAQGGCGGSGQGAFTDRQRAKYLGVHEDTWRHHWRNRYGAVRAIISKYDGIAKAGVAKRLSR